MKSIIIIMFIIGLLLLVSGYIEKKNNCPAPKIEYRYIPRSFYEEQISSNDLKKTYSDMFNEPSTWSTYPFNNKLEVDNKDTHSNFFTEDN